MIAGMFSCFSQTSEMGNKAGCSAVAPDFD